MASRTLKPRRLLGLSRDTHITILSFLSALDILKVGQTCRQLHSTTKSRTVWTNAVKRALDNLKIPLMVYKDILDAGPIVQLVDMALNPDRLRRKFRRKAKMLTPTASIHVTLPLEDGSQVIREVAITPDGRYMVTLGRLENEEPGEDEDPDRPNRLALWDLGRFHPSPVLVQECVVEETSIPPEELVVCTTKDGKGAWVFLLSKDEMDIIALRLASGDPPPSGIRKMMPSPDYRSATVYLGQTIGHIAVFSSSSNLLLWDVETNASTVLSIGTCATQVAMLPTEILVITENAECLSFPLPELEQQSSRVLSLHGPRVHPTYILTTPFSRALNAPRPDHFLPIHSPSQSSPTRYLAFKSYNESDGFHCIRLVSGRIASAEVDSLPVIFSSVQEPPSSTKGKGAASNGGGYSPVEYIAPWGKGFLGASLHISDPESFLFAAFDSSKVYSLKISTPVIRAGAGDGQDVYYMMHFSAIHGRVYAFSREAASRGVRIFEYFPRPVGF